MNMKLALAQMAMAPTIQENTAKALACIEEAADAGAGAILFPEVQFTPFFPQHPARDASRYLMSTEHETLRRLRSLCRDRRIVCVPNLYLREEGGRFDASPVIDTDGSIPGISRMVHIVQAPFFHEQDYYTPSRSGWRVHSTGAGRIGVVICFDRHFPESFLACAEQDAQLVVVPTANHTEEDLDLFEAEIRVAAMQNNLFVAMCNRVGVEDRLRFAGRSIVANPQGEIIVRADDREQILYAEMDFSTIPSSRRQRPYLALRRSVSARPSGPA